MERSTWSGYIQIHACGSRSGSPAVPAASTAYLQDVSGLQLFSAGVGWGGVGWGRLFRLCPKSSEGVLLFFMLDQKESVFSPLGDPG